MILAFKGWSPERHGRFSCRRDTPAPKKHDTTGGEAARRAYRPGLRLEAGGVL